MPFLMILLGAVLIVVAFNNTYRDLATALEQDVPGYFKWAVAIGAILGLGYLPGLKTPSRLLLMLVVTVVVLTQFETLKKGFTNFASSGGQTGAVTNPPPTPQSGGSGPSTGDIVKGAEIVAGL